MKTGYCGYACGATERLIFLLAECRTPHDAAMLGVKEIIIPPPSRLEDDAMFLGLNALWGVPLLRKADKAI